MGYERNYESVDEPDYTPFSSKPERNARQENLEVPLFVRLLGLEGRARMLEVGCGAGVALPALNRLCRSRRLVGLDVDGDALDAAAQRTRAMRPRVGLVQGDVRSMPFPDGCFDAVVDFRTCYHIRRGADAAREIERVLEPRGDFVRDSKLSQILSHPVRSYGRRLRLGAAVRLRPLRHRGFWRSFEKRFAAALPILLAALGCLAPLSPAEAQEVSPGARLRVTLTAASPGAVPSVHIGRYHALSDTTLVLVTRSAPLHIPLPEIGRVERSLGNRASLAGGIAGAVLGAGAGAVVGCAANRDSYGVFCGGDSDLTVATGAVVFGLLGGWLGARLFDSESWSPVDVRRDLARSPSPRR